VHFEKRLHEKTDLSEGPLHVYLFSSTTVKEMKIRMGTWRHL
jgi:hypothetical protein